MYALISWVIPSRNKGKQGDGSRVYIWKEKQENRPCVFTPRHLTKVQQRRLHMLANGLLMREITVREGIKHHVVIESIEGGKMDELFRCSKIF